MHLPYIMLSQMNVQKGKISLKASAKDFKKGKYTADRIYVLQFVERNLTKQCHCLGVGSQLGPGDY